MRRHWLRLAAARVKLVSGGTDNHLMLVDLRPARLTGKEMERRLDEVNHHRQQERHPQRPREAVRHFRYPRRHPRCHHPRPEGRGHEGDRPHHGYVARDFEGSKEKAQEAVVALTKKYPIYE